MLLEPHEPRQQVPAHFPRQLIRVRELGDEFAPDAVGLGRGDHRQHDFEGIGRAGFVPGVQGFQPEFSDRLGELRHQVRFLPRRLNDAGKRGVRKRAVFECPIEELLEGVGPRRNPRGERRVLQRFRGFLFGKHPGAAGHAVNEVELPGVFQPEAMPSRFDFVERAVFAVGQSLGCERGEWHFKHQFRAFAGGRIETDEMVRIARGREVPLGGARVVADQAGGAVQRVRLVRGEREIVEQAGRQRPSHRVNDLRHVVRGGGEDDPRRRRRAQEGGQCEFEQVAPGRGREPRLQCGIIEYVRNGQIRQLGKFRGRIRIAFLPLRAAPRLNRKLGIRRRGNVHQRVGKVRIAVRRNVRQHPPGGRVEQRQPDRQRRGHVRTAGRRRGVICEVQGRFECLGPEPGGRCPDGRGERRGRQRPGGVKLLHHGPRKADSGRRRGFGSGLNSCPERDILLAP